MLKYIMNVASDIFLVSIFVGLLFAFLHSFYGKTGKRISIIGLLVALAVSFTRSMITHNMRIVNGWKIGTQGYMYTLLAMMIALVITIVFLITPLRKRIPDKWNFIINIVICSMYGVVLTGIFFNAMSSVWYYPFDFYSADSGILNSDYLLKFLGYIIGILLAIVNSVCSYKIGMVLNKKGYKYVLVCITGISFALVAFVIFGKLMSILTARDIVKGIDMFYFAIGVTNNLKWFTYSMYIVLLVTLVFIWYRSYTQKEMYENSAIHRKQKVVWRVAKRATAFVLLGFVVTILCNTWFVDLTTVIISETPIDDPEIVIEDEEVNGYLRVKIEDIDDGHLHRYGYKTPDGYKTRFIVILKTLGTSNYGVGLDACEICGEAGYYENAKGQVVCKKCGVVMNTTTIGMKGGCNPIIIDYDITTEYLIVPISEMIKYQANFKK